MTNWFDRMAGGTRGQLLVMLRRSAATINDLAGELGISDNAVRTHIAALQRDGMVEHAGVLRSTGGKPAQLYRITREAEELFPKAYALVLGELIRVLEERDGRDGVTELLRRVGARAAAAQGVGGRGPGGAGRRGGGGPARPGRGRGGGAERRRLAPPGSRLSAFGGGGRAPGGVRDGGDAGRGDRGPTGARVLRAGRSASLFVPHRRGAGREVMG